MYKKNWRIVAPTTALLTLLLSACSGIAARPMTDAPATAAPVALPLPATPQPEPTYDAQPAIDNLTGLLAQWTGEPAQAITVLELRQTDWPNACLGAARPDEICAEVIVPGFAVRFAMKDAAYLIHTDRAGHRFRIIEAPEPRIGTPILEWSGHTEAEVGACGHAAIGPDGVGFGDCDAPMIQGRFVTPEHRGNLLTLSERYASFKTRTPIGSVAFNGTGSEIASEAVQRKIAEIARQVFYEARAGRTSASAAQSMQWQRLNASGTCEIIVIERTGEAAIFPCQGGTQPIRLMLSEAQLTQLYRWTDTLALFTHQAAGHSDATPDVLSFDGRGAATASEQDYRAMRAWLAEFSQSSAMLQLDAFETSLRESLAGRDYQWMQALMGDTFAIGYWRSEGESFGKAQAVDALKAHHLGATALAFAAYDGTTLGVGQTLENGITLVRAVRVTGWGRDGALEAVLLIGRRADGSHIWHSVVVSRDSLP
jgi:hypothetical protein